MAYGVLALGGLTGALGELLGDLLFVPRLVVVLLEFVPGVRGAFLGTGLVTL